MWSFLIRMEDIIRRGSHNEGDERETLRMEEKQKTCPDCGAVNPQDNRFCEACGYDLQSEDTIPEKETDGLAEKKGVSKKTKLLIGIILGVLILVAVVVGIVRYCDSKTTAEYHAKLSEAEKYMAEQDYEKAEDAYLQAIDIEPKKDDAYLQVADVYVTQEHYEDAEKILQKGEENAGGKKIQIKLTQVKPYGLYDDYLQNTIVPDTGLADVEEQKSLSSLKSGLVSAEIRDFDKDEIPDLLTVAYADEMITITLYTCVDDKVTELDSMKEEALYDYDVQGSKIDVFLKEREDKTYLIFGEEYLSSSCSDIISKVFQIDDSIELQCSVTALEDIMAYTYKLNDQVIADYDGESEGYDEDEYKRKNNKAVAALSKAMEPYGFSSDELVVKEQSYLSLCRAKYNEKDTGETWLSHFQMGHYVAESQIDLTANAEVLLIEDKTGLRSRIK